MSPTAQTEAADQGSAQSQPCADMGSDIPCSPRVLTPLESELLTVLRTLTAMARTSGGTAGPDAALMSACGEAEAIMARVDQ